MLKQARDRYKSYTEESKAAGDGDGSIASK
jgi:hypothetical protein